jgi:hypothetical protein
MAFLAIQRRTSLALVQWSMRATTVTLLAVAMAGVTGCVPGEDLDPGPMSAGADVNVTCLQERGSTDFTNGSNVLRYSGSEPLTITKVDLVYRSGMEVADAVLVPVGTSLVGSSSQWPPAGGLAALKGSIPAVGATMGRDGVPSYNLVAHLTRADVTKHGTASALRIFYRVGDREWGTVATSYLGVKYARGSCR